MLGWCLMRLLLYWRYGKCQKGRTTPPFVPQSIRPSWSLLTTSSGIIQSPLFFSSRSLPLLTKISYKTSFSKAKSKIFYWYKPKKSSKAVGKNICSLLHISVIHPIWMGQDGCHMGHSHIGTFSKYMFTSAHTAGKDFNKLWWKFLNNYIQYLAVKSLVFSRRAQSKMWLNFRIPDPPTPPPSAQLWNS